MTILRKRENHQRNIVRLMNDATTVQHKKPLTPRLKNQVYANNKKPQ